MARMGNHRAAREGVLVHTFDAWGRYVRGVVMLSACRPVRGLSGKDYGPPPFSSHHSAALELVRRKSAISNFSHGEPSWHLQQSAMDAVAVLRIPNAVNVVSALGGSIVTGAGAVVSSPLVDLTAVRNFIAHKGPSAGAKCSVILRAAGCRSVLEWLDQPVAGIPRFHEVVANLRAISDVAAG